MVSVLSPCGVEPSEEEWSSNNRSIVIRLQYGDSGPSVLLPGDIEEEVEELLVREKRLSPTTILKLSHHGSGTSTSPTFLKSLEPEVAMASVGRWNRFHFPHPSIVEALNKKGVSLYRTDIHGGIRLKIDLSGYLVETMSGIVWP